MKKQFGAVILSGGNSVRMGKPKAFLKFGHITFLEKIISVYQQAGLTNLVIVLNSKLFSHKIIWLLLQQYKNVEWINNPLPELGRFYSIKLGLHKLSGMDYCFIQNIDNPFITVSFLGTMMENKNPDGYTLPVYKEKGGHPVLVSDKIIKHINGLTYRDTNLHDILEKFSRKEIPVDTSDILANINTSGDYANCFVMRKNR